MRSIIASGALAPRGGESMRAALAIGVVAWPTLAAAQTAVPEITLAPVEVIATSPLPGFVLLVVNMVV